MLGALVKLTGTVKLASLDNPVKERFGRIAQKNLTAAKRAYDEVRIINYPPCLGRGQRRIKITPTPTSPVEGEGYREGGAFSDEGSK
ncbi:MAG: hypothetical protein A2Z43_09480 [Syntrophobacterales bacterium RBG_19FT_COMBO_59_10]|nr:MAG: hypothetical protein A2Z43_09480 [Syntrophobacterales bacterium RBG_19FT_COMBO_59_10]